MPDDAGDAYTSTQDTLPPFSDQSVIAPSLQRFLSTHSASAFPLPFPEENQHDRHVDLYYKLDSNTMCLLISGGNEIYTPEYETFTANFYRSMQEFCKLVIEQSNITNKEHNIKIISPYENYTDIEIKDIFQTIIKRHNKKTFRKFLLYIVGHAPDNKGFFLRNNHYIQLSDLEALTESLKSCELQIIIKDMCSAAKFDLLPSSNSMPNDGRTVHVQWSSCGRDGSSWCPIYSDCTFFSSCIAKGYEGRSCPRGHNGCDICAHYRNKIQHRNVTYGLLSDLWIEPHMRDLWIEPHMPQSSRVCDLPVLDIRHY